MLRHLPAEVAALVVPMLPVFPGGPGPRGGRRPVCAATCLDAVIDVARGTRWRDVRQASHGVSRDTVLKRLRFWSASGAFGEILDLLVLRGVLSGALDLSRFSIDSRSIRAKKGARIPAPIRPIGASRASSTT